MDAGAQASARRLLSRLRGVRLSATGFDTDGAILAAVAATVSAAPTTEIEDAALALVVHAGLALADRGATHAALHRVEDDIHQIPETELLPTLAIVERLLARIDPEWGWRLIDRVIGADVALEHAIGLDIAAALDRADRPGWDPEAAPSVVARQLGADRDARQVINGRVAPERSTLLARLNADPTGSELLASEASVALVALAVVAPGQAVSAASKLLCTFDPAQLAEPMRLAAAAVAHAGLGEELVHAAYTESYVSVQATWSAAAAATSALQGDALTSLCRELAERTDDELDPGREPVAGMPLLEALGFGGSTGMLAELAEHWSIEPRRLVERLLFAGAPAAAANLLRSPDAERFGRVRDARYRNGPDSRESWWPASGDVARRVSAAQDGLAVVAANALRPLPGTLAELLGTPLRIAGGTDQGSRPEAS